MQRAYRARLAAAGKVVRVVDAAGIRSRRRWHKLHLGVDADTHGIVAAGVTPDDVVGDISELPHLPDQIDAERR